MSHKKKETEKWSEMVTQKSKFKNTHLRSRKPQKSIHTMCGLMEFTQCILYDIYRYLKNTLL